MFIKGGREMNKKVIGAVLSVTMILAAGTTVFASGAAEGKTFAIVTKAAGNHIMRKKQMDLKKQSRMREEK